MGSVICFLREPSSRPKKDRPKKEKKSNESIASSTQKSCHELQSSESPFFVPLYELAPAIGKVCTIRRPKATFDLFVVRLSISELISQIDVGLL